MTRIEATQAARAAADHYRQMGTLTHPDAEGVDNRPVLDVVRVATIGPSVPLVHVKNARKYSITLKGYQWLQDNQEGAR